MRSRPMIPFALSLLGTGAAWCDYRIPFDVPAPTADSANRLYGVQASANSTSRASALVRDSSLVLVADTIASDSAVRLGYDGYTADVGVSIPLQAEGCSFDLRTVEAITFEYRSSQPITDRLTVQLASAAYPDAALAVGAKLEASVTGGENLAAGAWKTATLRRSDFAAPQWAEAIEGMPAVDTILRYLGGIRITPRTTYSQSGTTRDGGTCTNCTAPTMTRQTLEIRNLTMKAASAGFKVSLLLKRWGYGYEGSSTDTALLRARYGIQAFSNAASRTELSMVDGAVVLRETLASDSGAKGRVGFSAEAGVYLPVRYDGLQFNATFFASINFEFRNSERITDYLAVKLETDAYPDSVSRIDGMFEAAIKGSTNLAAGTAWKSASIDVADFSTISWFVPPVGYPDVQTAVTKLRGFRFVPKSIYTDSGVYNDTVRCPSCTSPTMKTQTLEIRNIRLDVGNVYLKFNPQCADVGTPSGVVRNVQHARFAASYGNGLLSVESIPGYAKIEVVSASGRRVAAFDAGTVPLAVALDAGTWYVVARGPGKPVLVRPLAVTR